MSQSRTLATMPLKIIQVSKYDSVNMDSSDELFSLVLPTLTLSWPVFQYGYSFSPKLCCVIRDMWHWAPSCWNVSPSSLVSNCPTGTGCIWYYWSYRQFWLISLKPHFLCISKLSEILPPNFAVLVVKRGSIQFLRDHTNSCLLECCFIAEYNLITGIWIP